MASNLTQQIEVKKSLVGEDDTDSEDELPPPPAHTGRCWWTRSEQCDGWTLAVAGFASIHALTSMTSDGRPVVEDVEDPPFGAPRL